MTQVVINYIQNVLFVRNLIFFYFFPSCLFLLQLWLVRKVPPVEAVYRNKSSTNTTMSKYIEVPAEDESGIPIDDLIPVPEVEDRDRVAADDAGNADEDEEDCGRDTVDDVDEDEEVDDDDDDVSVDDVGANENIQKIKSIMEHDRKFPEPVRSDIKEFLQALINFFMPLDATGADFFTSAFIGNEDITFKINCSKLDVCIELSEGEIFAGASRLRSICRNWFRQFILSIKISVVKWITSIGHQDHLGDSNYPKDKDREKIERDIEFVVDFFPSILTELYMHDEIWYDAFSAASRFCPEIIPKLTELGIKHQQFDEQQRGGLIPWALQNLIWTGSRNYNDDAADGGSDRWMNVLKRLREIGFLQKNDTETYNLLRFCCARDSNYTQNEIFIYLCHYNPDGLKPALFQASKQPPSYNIDDGFKQILEAGMRHRRNEFGFLFHKDIEGKTPFLYACTSFGKMNVMNAINDVLVGDGTETPPSSSLEDKFYQEIVPYIRNE
jgi:hypothetical protein